MLGSANSVGVIGQKTLLGQDIETGKQPQRLSKIDVVDVAAPFLIEQLEWQQTRAEC